MFVRMRSAQHTRQSKSRIMLGARRPARALDQKVAPRDDVNCETAHSQASREDEMPAAELRVGDQGICRFKDGKDEFREVVSNFSITLLARVNVEREAGGPGVLVRVKRFPDNVERFVTQII